MSNRGALALIKPIAIGLGSGAALLGLIIGSFSLANPATTEVAQPSATPTASSTPTPTASETPSATPSATATAKPCSVAKYAADKALGKFQAMVVNAKTLKTLYSVKEDKASSTASTMKLLTATVALQVLGSDYRITTKVMQDADDPTVIYLVGGGDVTLSTTGKGKQSVYYNAPKLITLAADVKKALGEVQITKIVADSSLFPGSNWLKSWERSEQTQGYMSEVSALQVDGDRSKPSLEASWRSSKPDIRAAKSFQDALGSLADGASVSAGTAPESASKIASIKSQPIGDWLPHMIKMSDNTQAEALARLTALKLGLDGDFASIDKAYKQVFEAMGLDASGQKFMDGSGLSDYNAVSPAFMIQVLDKIYHKDGELELVKNSLAVAGESGTLAARFTGKNAVARGHVYAKTGWINHGYTLAGWLKARDGSRQLFVVYALGNVDESAKQAIDSIVTAFFKCGDRLTND